MKIEKTHLDPFLAPYGPKASKQNISKQVILKLTFALLWHDAKNQKSSEDQSFKKREKPHFGTFWPKTPEQDSFSKNQALLLFKLLFNFIKTENLYYEWFQRKPSDNLASRQTKNWIGDILWDFNFMVQYVVVVRCEERRNWKKNKLVKNNVHVSVAILRIITQQILKVFSSVFYSKRTLIIASN